MKAITAENYNRAKEVLYSTFKDNPGAMWVVRKDQHLDSRLKELVRFCLKVSMLKKGAFLSDDESGVALILNSNVKLSIINAIPLYLRLAHKCVGWTRALPMIRREMRIRAKRPTYEHLYFWMLGITDHSHGLSTIIDLRDGAFDLSKELKLPIYAETAITRTKRLYERYHFKVYDQWEPKELGSTLWFLHRPLAS